MAHDPESGTANAADPKTHFLFVCGVPRSGTTALAALLNSHPDIFLGIERYKNLGNDQFGPDLFTADRYFDARLGDTNNVVSIDAAARVKFAQALWVGDKVPRYYARYGTLLNAFPDSRILYIVRNLHDVAESWNKRARNPRDRWPAQNDYLRAVEEWNLSLQRTIRIIAKFPKRITVVNYDELFSGDLLVLRRILQKLDLTVPKEMLKFFRTQTKGWQDRIGKNIVPQEQTDYLDAHADWAAFETLRQKAVPGLARTPRRAGGV